MPIFFSNAFDLHLGVGILRVQQGLDMTLVKEDEEAKGSRNSPDYTRRKHSLSQMSQGRS